MATKEKRHEPTPISAEEFQQFQTQLLDLRHANIVANDALLRSEARVKQLEAELTNSTTNFFKKNSSRNHEHIKRLDAENRELRDKLMTTESSFKLQCSTLRAECHHLSTEMSKLLTKIGDHQTSSESLLAHNPSFDDDYRTILVKFQDTGVQVTTDAAFSTELVHSVSSSASSLQAPLYDYCSLLKDGLFILERRVTRAEADMADAINLSQQNLFRERQLLVDQVATLEVALSSAKSVEADLQNQIRLIKSRSSRMNKELRLQLIRFIRSGAPAGPVLPHAVEFTTNESHMENNDNITLRPPDINPKSHGHQRENSSASLSSTTSCWSLLSNPAVASLADGAHDTSASADSTRSVGNSSVKEHGSSCIPAGDGLQLPTGFFSASDFKALVDRMSEVQEENCILRRQVQRLQSDLAAKNLILHTDMNNRCQNDDTSFSTTPYSTSKWLPSIWKSPSSSSTSLETVNRLKKLCEDLLNENIRLRHQLEQRQ